MLPHTLILAVLMVLPPSAADRPHDRGTYYRDADHGYELWIPRGFKTRKPDKGEVVYFTGSGAGGTPSWANSARSVP